MRKTITLILLLLATSLSGQIIQEGVTRELNSNRKPISDVFIKFKSAPSTNSDNKGIFRLSFQGKNAGDEIFLEDIRKIGYKLVNRKDFKVTRLSNSNKFPFDIILAKTGVLEATRREYYDTSNKALTKFFKRKESHLKEKLKTAQINQIEFKNKYRILKEQYEQLTKRLHVLSDMFAHVNFDDAVSIYKEALILFKAGEIEKCMKILESADLIARTNESFEKIENLNNEANRIKLDLQRAIEPIYLQAQTYILQFEFEKAEILFDQLLLIDSSNLNILLVVSDFYENQHLYKKAIEVYSKIIKSPLAEAWHVARACNSMGNMHMESGYLDKAFFSYNESLKFLKETSYYSINNTSISSILISIGDYYSLIGNTELALNNYQKSGKLLKKMYKQDSSNLVLKQNLAIVYQRFGNEMSSQGKFKKALHFYSESLPFTKDLYEEYSKSLNFMNGLTITYNKLGRMYVALGDYENALSFFKLENELFNKNRDVLSRSFDLKYGLAISHNYLGDVFVNLGDSKKALVEYNMYETISKELFDDYPYITKIKDNLAVSYSKLGIVYKVSEDYDKALQYFEKQLILMKELCQESPQNVEYKFHLAKSYIYLGGFNFEVSNDKVKAKYYLFKAESILKKLVEDAPEVTEYKEELYKIRLALSLNF